MKAIFQFLLTIVAIGQGFLLLAVLITGLIGVIQKDYKLFKKLGKYWLILIGILIVIVIIWGLTSVASHTS